MCRNSIICTSVNILITMEELVFIYCLIDVIKRHDYLNTMETAHCSEAIPKLLKTFKFASEEIDPFKLLTYVIIFILSDSDCTIDSKVLIIFLIIPKLPTFVP